MEKTESEIIELSRNAVNLKSSFVELTEMKQVLEKAQVFLTEVRQHVELLFLIIILNSRPTQSGGQMITSNRPVCRRLQLEELPPKLFGYEERGRLG